MVYIHNYGIVKQKLTPVGLLLIAGLFAFLATFGVFTNANAAKPVPQQCATIKDGTIKYGRPDSTSTEIIPIGYDKWGYNYQARIFNGWYNNSGRPSTVATSGDRLVIKWNDAWLSNKDCVTQVGFDADEEPEVLGKDGRLDRHMGYENYQGSGAWLTNHISGTYEEQSITGSYVINFEWNNGNYPNDVTLTQTGGTVAGTIGWQSGQVPYAVEGTVNGNIVGNVVTLTVNYDDRSYDRTMNGVINADGSITGTWVDANAPTSDNGNWNTVTGVASTTTQSWNYFTKIVAVPADARLDAGIWYTTDDVEIGPQIWGVFATIQEIYNDTGTGEHGLQYKSALRSGLGNW